MELSEMKALVATLKEEDLIKMVAKDGAVVNGVFVAKENDGNGFVFRSRPSINAGLSVSRIGLLELKSLSLVKIASR